MTAAGGPLGQWLRWYVVVQALAVLALPLSWNMMRRLPDRGYSAAKALGILLHGLVLWLGTSYGLLRNEVGGAVLAAALVGLLGLFCARGARREDGRTTGWWRWLREHWKVVAAMEGAFLFGFAAWAVVRAHNPAADHTEQPMDLLFLSGVRTSATFPPRDPWLSGYAISYYYFGHWMVSAIGLLAGQPPETSYNLGLACWFGLLVAGSFGIGFNLAALERPTSLFTSLGTGALAAVMVAAAGNLQGTLDAGQRLGLDLSALARGRLARNFEKPAEHWWWWRSSRVLEDRDAAGGPVVVIDEFPAFSYVIGDDHPHVLAMPFALLVVALALNLFVSSSAAEAGPPSLLALTSGIPGLVLLVAAAGALVFLNTWDFPAYGFVVVASAFVAAKNRGDGGGAAVRLAIRVAAALLAGSVAVYLPYLLSAQSQVQGLRVNLDQATPLSQLLLMFGPQLLAVACLLLAVAPRPSALPRNRAALVATAVAVMVVLVALAGARGGERLPTLALVLGLLAMVTSRLLRQLARRDAAPAVTFALLLAGVGLLLLLAPELVYVQDGFGTRMNTVFKLYYQAWLLLGLAGAYGIAHAWTRPPLRPAAAFATLAIGSGLVFTASAAYSVTGGFGSPTPTFDALDYLREASPDERAAIEWIRSHTPADAIVAQGIGSSYASDQARLSVATGRATLLGWEGHELQWRGRAFGRMSAGRREALEALYARSEGADLDRLLEAWRIDFVFLGPAERRRYGVDSAREARLARSMDVAFAEGDVRIYRRRAGVPGS
jgi:YYY domain-containing protein